MGKYSKYVNNLRLWTEIVRPSYRGKIADFSLIFDQKVFPEAKIWVETFHVYAPGSGVMVPDELPIIVEGKEIPESTKGGQHSHPDFDELFLFFGSNPHDVLSLGGEVEFWLGEGKDAQKFIANTPTAEWVPRGVAHNPHLFTKVVSRDKPIIEMAIAMTSKYPLEPATMTPLPPAFSFEKVGKEQKGKGLYTKYVNEIKFATDRLFPFHRGMVAVPTLMFDKNTYPNAKMWVEIFHIYAGGAGIMLPTLEAIILKSGMPGTGAESGGHAHDFDELFLYIGLDPHDTLNLGGEVEFWLGEGKDAEKFVTTKATAVWVPGGVVHNPQVFRRVDRPYLMVVIAMTDEYAEGNMRFTPLPPGFKL